MYDGSHSLLLKLVVLQVIEVTDSHTLAASNHDALLSGHLLVMEQVMIQSELVMNHH